MLQQLRDVFRVVAVASTNIVAAAAAAVLPASTVRTTENYFLHDLLTVVQIVVGILTGTYVAFKLYRAIRGKRLPEDPGI